MGNMSYCRFQNTLSDLKDCVEAMYDIDGNFQELSKEEARAAKALIVLCDDLVISYGHLSDEE